MKANIQDIKEIWCNILGMENVDIQQKFYDLGGNSVMLLIILDEINQKYRMELPISDMNQFDTVTDMTDYINRKNRGMI